MTVAGTPGGSRIFTFVYQVLSNIYDYGMDVEQAVRSLPLPSSVAIGNRDQKRTVFTYSGRAAELVAQGYAAGSHAAELARQAAGQRAAST